MLAIALELAREHPAYEDMATKFFEHFVAITDAMNTLGGTGLWCEALERYQHFYGDELRVEYPTGSGRLLTLGAVARALSRRLAGLFLPDADGRRPCHGDERRYARDPHWKDLVLFHEYFHGDDGRGLGASHQTGWTALVTRCLEDSAR